ncbi:MAG: NAD(P)-dependent oxidoreductase [Candidatus Saccharibacteria bacterium]|nr:NAD(P)-dependent oxidoreductase [Candidatus Saccharibacteria bacterium]
MNFKEKVVIITGGSSGIGLAAARQLAAQGALVAIAAPGSDTLDEVADSIERSVAIPTDMTDDASVQAMVKKVHEHFGRIDILINNAGKGYESPLELVEADKVRYLFDLHVVGPLVAVQAVLPIMRAQSGGRIVNVSTPTAKMALPGLGAYSLTKIALTHMTLVMRKELAKDNIEVSAFYPFITSSQFGKNVFKMDPREMEAKAQRQDFLPDPDSAEFTASRLIESIGSNKKEFMARGNAHFVWGIIKKRFKKK